MTATPYEVNLSVTGSNPSPFPQFIVPVRNEMFFGLNFMGPVQPASAETYGEFRFDGGAFVAANCGNCTSLYDFRSDTALEFDTLLATGTFTLSEPYNIDTISISYQVRDLPNVVPEPGTWGLMILGFGAAGAVIRRRRRTYPVAAA